MALRATRLLTNANNVQTGTGTEPTIIDPATGQTRLVRDINPGVDSSTTTQNPTRNPFTSTEGTFAALAGGLTVFGAIDPANGQELWVTDGTRAGTRLVAALQPGGTHGYTLGGGRDALTTVTVAGSAARNFASLDATRALFTAFDGSNVSRLWVTDGTAAGTRAISDAVPVTTDVNLATQIVSLGNGRALFAATDAARGTELWVTDGTAGGTRLVRDVRPGTASSTPTSITPLGDGRALFTATEDGGSALWLTDGTEAGTTRVTGLSNPRFLATLRTGLVLFWNQDTSFRFQPWITDGTAAGTRQVADINPVSNYGPADVQTTGFGALGNGRALFFANSADPAGGSAPVKQLWSTDGTAAGTVVVRGFGLAVTQGQDVSRANFVSLADGRTAFYVSTAVILNVFATPLVAQPEATLWVSDGTAAGTVPLSDKPDTSSLGALSGAQLVDAPFYYGHYADVAGAVAVSAQHYDASGWREGRDPNGLFSTPGYRSFYKDVGAAGINPLSHYDTAGWREGRDPSAAFDTNLYLLFNPDVRSAGLDPLQHWLADGQVEGRRMSAVVDSANIRNLFDPTFYGLSNSDVTGAGADLLTHFSRYGVNEGRNPDAYFDVKYYLARNPDVAASGINPVAHYLDVGWKEGRDPSTHFSTAKYLAAYADVKAAGINPLQHFLANGIIEGRSGFGDRI